MPLNFKSLAGHNPRRRKKPFSELKLCLKSYEETENMHYPAPDESNNILQMKTTFKMIKPRKNILTMIINQQIITITRNLSRVKKTITPTPEDKYYLLHL